MDGRWSGRHSVKSPPPLTKQVRGSEEAGLAAGGPHGLWEGGMRLPTGAQWPCS